MYHINTEIGLGRLKSPAYVPAVVPIANVPPPKHYALRPGELVINEVSSMVNLPRLKSSSSWSINLNVLSILPVSVWSPAEGPNSLRVTFFEACPSCSGGALRTQRVGLVYVRTDCARFSTEALWFLEHRSLSIHYSQCTRYIVV